MRPITRDAVGVAIFVGLVLGVPLLFGGERALQGALQDDAYYYAGIARNVARGSGLTFDGIHLTSGFHPLWLGALVPVFAVFSGLVPPLVAAEVLQVTLVGVAAALTTATLARRFDRFTAFAGGVALIAIPRTGASLVGGLEGALTLAAVVAAWRIWLDAANSPRVDPSGWIAPGTVLALAGLSRLEAFVLVPVALVLGVRSMKRPAVSAAALLAPSAVAGVVIVGASRALTGTWLPISAAIKATARMQGAGDRTLPTMLSLLLAAVGAGAAGIGAWRAAPGGKQFLLLLPAAGASLWISADLLSVGTLEPWNRVPVLLLGVVAVAALGSRSLGRPLAAAVMLGAAVRLPIAIVRDPVSASSYAPYRWAAGRWLGDHLGPDARVGSWNAGTIGYVSDRPVVNLDGLVNDGRYFDEVIRGRNLPGYLKAEGITWIADQSCGFDPTLAPYLRRTGSLELALRSEVVASFFDRSSPDGCPGVAIWRVRDE